MRAPGQEKLPAKAPWSPPAQADLTRRFDAIVIGSGIGGASAAYRLATLGLETLLVEKGEFLHRRPPSEGPPGLYMGDVHGLREKPFNYVGGQTKFFGGAMYRLRASDFVEVEHESGCSPAWPIGYQDLEPYYDQAERLYRVHGTLDGDPTEPPHARGYPWPALAHRKPVDRVVERLRAAGVQVSSMPKGLDYGAGGPCILCATCDGYLCTLDAKLDAEIAAVRPGVASGRLHVSTGSESLRLLTTPSGRTVDGVVIRRDGADHAVRAPKVVVAAGLGATAGLLRTSRTDAHPHGLGNAGGALGRFLCGQSMGTLFPLIGPIQPAHVKTFAIHEFYHGTAKCRFPMGALQATGQLPFWRSASPWARPFARALGAISLMCIYVTEALPSAETGFRFDGDRIVDKTPPLQNQAAFAAMRRASIESFQRAGYRSVAPKSKPYSKSEGGTARFGNDPSHSVANPDGQVHGVKGLYVADASILPSAGAVNTGLTIAALALRTGDKIAAQSS